MGRARNSGSHLLERINAVPLLGFGVLPRLFVDVLLHKPGVAYSGLIDVEEGQQLSSSLVESSMSMWAPLIPPLLITAHSGPKY